MTPYRQLRRLVFAATMLVATGAVAGYAVQREPGPTGGSVPDSAIAGGAATTAPADGGVTTTSAPTAPSGFGRLAGVWEGEGNQFSTDQDWTISMALQPGRAQRIAGIIAYPSLACGGELTLLEASGTQVQVREDITYGDCIDNGSIVVRPASSGRLDWKYYLPDGTQDAASTLTRSR